MKLSYLIFLVFFTSCTPYSKIATVDHSKRKKITERKAKKDFKKLGKNKINKQWISEKQW